MGQARGDLRNQAWRRKRKLVLERDSYECQIRGRGCTVEATEVDHIVAHALGGDASLDNLRAACKPCNASLGTAARRGGRTLTRAPHPSPPQARLSPQGPVSGPTRGVWHLELPA